MTCGPRPCPRVTSGPMRAPGLQIPGVSVRVRSFGPSCVDGGASPLRAGGGPHGGTSHSLRHVPRPPHVASVRI